MCRFKNLILFGIALAGLGLPWPTPGFSQAPEPVTWTTIQTEGNEKTKEKKSHRLEVGDRLRVKIYPEDEYIKGGEVEVSSEGTITLPLLGKVGVKGRLLPEVEQEIMRLLAADYIVNPVVVIEVAERIVEKEKRTVAVLGQVQKPGTFEIPPEQKLTLLQVILMAGGFTNVANVEKIKVVRKEKDKTRIIKANAESIISGKTPDVELKAGDIVHVAESFF